MLAPKSKSLYVELSDFSILTAVVSGLDAPLTIESLHEISADKPADEVKDFFDSILENKGRYVQGRCGVYPKSRFVRRTTLEQPAKAKDPAFLVELLKERFRIDPAENSIAVVNAVDGTEFDSTKNLAAQKELLFCGASRKEMRQQQERIVDLTVFPDRIELGSVSTVGALMHYHRLKKIKFPTLVLEITQENSNIFIFTGDQLDICRPIPYGLNSMFPVIQKELSLKDEESARKLFFSNTFDFTEMGPVLLRKMLKELQASTGFYEVQTGQTIGQIFLTLLPKNLSWIATALSRSLGVDILHIDYPGWLKAIDVNTSEAVQLESLDSRWLSLFSLVGRYSKGDNGA